MNNLSFLAELWGIFMIIIPLSLLINQQLIKKIFAFADDELVLFFSGIVSFMLGTASVLSYNVWSANWGLLITIFGWIAILKGLTFLFWPDMARKTNDKIKNKLQIPYLLLAAVFIGLFVVYLGFTAK